MAWVAVGTAGAALISGYAQNRAAKKAAGAQQQGTDAAIAEQQAAREQYQQNINPYLQLGQQGVSSLQNLVQDPNSFANSQAYQFLRDSSLSALDRSAAARGGLGSGGADADRIALASGLASQEYGNEFNRRYNLASLGQNAAAGAGSMGQQSANQIGNLYGAQGQIGADRAINQANLTSNVLGTLGTAFGTYMGNRAPRQPSSTSIYSFGNNAQWGQGIPGSGGY